MKINTQRFRLEQKWKIFCELDRLSATLYFVNKILRTVITTIAIIICYNAIGLSQTYTAKIQPDSLSNFFKIDSTYPSINKATEDFREGLEHLHKIGYLSASIDSISVKNQQIIATIYVGEQIQSFKILNGNIEQQIFQQIVEQKPLTNWASVEQLKQKVINYYASKGCLTTTVYIDSIELNRNFLKGKLYADVGNPIYIDTLILQGDIILKDSYIKKYFQLKRGDLLTSNTIKELEINANQSTLFTPTADLKIAFKNNKATLYLPVKEKKGNQFDLLIGLAPNPNPQLTQKKMLVTGQGNLLLQNPLGSGRELLIDYKQLQPESPILTGNIYLPTLLFDQFGARANFELQKQDTSFIQINYLAGLNYLLQGNKHFLIGYKASTSYLQRVDTTFVKQTGKLPKSADFTKNIYYSSIQNSTLNATVAPTKGTNYHIQLGIGNRTIKPNETVLQLNSPLQDFNALYSSFNKNKLLVETEAKLSYFLPLKKNATILFKNYSGYKHLNTYFFNDMTQLGGINNLRGFDERSLLANNFSIQTTEYRLLLNEASYFSLFSDVAFLEDSRLQKNNFYYSFGSGLNLSTPSGLFSMQLAAGNSTNNQFDIGKTRIHFGYVTIF